MLKNAYFLEKDVKKSPQSRGPPEPSLTSGGWELRPQNSALLFSPTITTLSSSVLALNSVYYFKRTNFASFNFLQLFFTSNSVVFVDRGAKIFLAPGRRVP